VGRASELTKLISVSHADTGDDGESHGPVWLGLAHAVGLRDVLLRAHSNGDVRGRR
jgi:hypothetical protein